MRISTKSGMAWFVASLLTNVTGTSVVDAGLTCSTTYYYIVSALNSGGESVNSSEVNATTAGLPVPVAVTNSIGVSVADHAAVVGQR